ncbi:hypothetical protein BH24DEI2_BH24DEI2_18770 [soil metagenome]
MLRRFFAGNETSEPDYLLVVDKLLKLPTFGERSLFVLRQLTALLPGDVRGYVVRREEGEQVRFDAVEGYGSELLELKLSNGPWRDSRTRIISNIVPELFTPNPQEVRALLGDLGLRDVKSTLMVPISGGGHFYGTLFLHRHTPPLFVDDDLKTAKRWSTLLGEVQGQHYERVRARQSLVEFTRAFVEAIEAKDFTQLGHAGRVAAYALAVGRALGFDKERLADLYYAAMLHDVGKLGSGLALTIEDSQHPQRGANLVASSPLLMAATAGIRSHHENWDGSGFPDGLHKDEIPILGRIVAVADTFDLLSSERGQALAPREVEQALALRSGHELDPELVNLFINILRQGKSTAELGRLDKQDLPF